MVAVAVEGEHGVDQVLDGPRAGQVAVLGHVARRARAARRSTWPGGSGARRRPAPGPGCRPAGPASGSDTDWSESTTTRAGCWRSTAASIALDVGALEASRCAGHRTEALRPPADLGQRLLGRGQHDVGPRGGHRGRAPGRAGSTCRSGRPEEQGDRAADHATAEDAVELAHAGRQRTRGVGGHTGEASRAPPPWRCRRGTGVCRRACAGVERVPLPAARAAPDPAQGRRRRRSRTDRRASRRRARAAEVGGHAGTLRMGCHTGVPTLGDARLGRTWPPSPSRPRPRAGPTSG